MLSRVRATGTIYLTIFIALPLHNTHIHCYMEHPLQDHARREQLRDSSSVSPATTIKDSTFASRNTDFDPSVPPSSSQQTALLGTAEVSSWSDAACSELCPFLFFTFWHWLREERHMATSALQHIQSQN